MSTPPHLEAPRGVCVCAPAGGHGWAWAADLVGPKSHVPAGWGRGSGAGLTQAEAELPSGEEAGVRLVQAFKHSLQLFGREGQVALQALAGQTAGLSGQGQPRGRAASGGGGSPAGRAG